MTYSEIDSEKIKQALAERWINQCFSEKDKNVSVGEWEILDFSSCFTVEAKTDKDMIGVYVKVPKSEINYLGIIPQVALDVRMAEEEYKSLTFLAEHWNGSESEVSFVEPLAFFSEYNAIVTRRAYARELFLLWRHADLKGHLSAGIADDAWLARMRRIGKSIRKFHDNATANSGLKADCFSGKSIVDKIVRNIHALQEFGVDFDFLNTVLAHLDPWSNFETKCNRTMTLKGLDIRNVLIDENDRIYLLDPGKLKPDCCTADLARFLVTCEIIYWGTLWFFLRVRPLPDYLDAVLTGYGDLVTGDDRVTLRLYTLKEFFKHWRAAHIALSLKKWPAPVKWTLRIAYINPFFQQVVAKLLDELEN